MRWLVFDLAAPLASFGAAAPGSIRDSEGTPSRGALLGLIAAALGIRRDEPDRHAALSAALRFASRVNRSGDSRLLRDYHTAQAPKEAALKGRPRQTRRDELAVPKQGLSTVLSDRYYHTDFVATAGAAVQGDEFDAEMLAERLRRPRFTLYLGRKSCPLHWPLHPQVVDAADWLSALRQHDGSRAAQRSQWRQSSRSRYLPEPSAQVCYTWDETLDLGETLARQHLAVRRDQPTNREAWLYSERREWIADACGSTS